jgi:hypothetical protein
MTGHFPRFCLLVVVLATVGLHHVHAAPVDQLRYRRPIAVEASAGEELVAVGLDAEVAAVTETGFPDLRVIDGAGQEVSRIVRRASVVMMRSVRRSFPVHQTRVKPLPGGGLEIELTIDPEKHPVSIDGFRIETPLRNFEQAVQVQRLDEAGGWRSVGDEALLFDYSQYMDTRQLDVPVPKEPRLPAGGTWRITVDEPTIEQQSTLSEVVRRRRSSPGSRFGSTRSRPGTPTRQPRSRLPTASRCRLRRFASRRNRRRSGRECG